MKKEVIIEGILFIVLGILAMIWPHFSTVALELLLGWLFLFSGLFQLYNAFQKKTHFPFVQSLLLAAAYAIIGLLLLFYPYEGRLSLALLLAILFFLQGLYAIFLSFRTSFPPISKAWLFVSGGISIVLGFFIWMKWPQDASWIIGLFTGANLFLLGISYLVLGRFFPKV